MILQANPCQGAFTMTWFSQWLRRRSGTCTTSQTTQRRLARPARKAAPARLMLESLENRTVPSAAAAYGQLPLTFEINEGQAATQDNFVCHGSGYSLALTPTRAMLGLDNRTATDALSLQVVGANPSAEPVGQDLLPTRSNYFIGNDSSKWLTDIPNYGEVEYQDVYSGINLLYYGNQGQLEYDFVVSPGADASAIRLSIQGAQSVNLDTQGNLVLHTSGGDVVEHAPVVYQDVGGQRQSVAGQFVLDGNGQVGFQLGAYDPSAPLVIDPVLVYSTYLGGSGNDSAAGMAVDSAGNAYITGTTTSTNFPTTPGALQTRFDSNSSEIVFVSKLNASGTALVYSTYLGGISGGSLDHGRAIAVDASGDAYITGFAGPNFPTTSGAFQQTSSVYGAFVTELNATGSALVYSTYLTGSSGGDQGFGIAVNAAGNAYVTGTAVSPDFPTTPNSFDPVYSLAVSESSGTMTFVSELNLTGSALVYSTFLGGSYSYGDQGNGIAVDSAGDAYVAGETSALDFPTVNAFQATDFNHNPYYANETAFVTKFNATGSALLFSTYLGGSDGSLANGIAVDASGAAFVTGNTGNAGPTTFPLTPGAFQTTYGGSTDAFVTKFDASGTRLIYSTLLGGSSNDGAAAIVVDGSGDAYVTGSTQSTDFPLKNALQGFNASPGSNGQAYVSELNSGGSALVFSTYFGGSGGAIGYGIALDGSGNIYVAGAAGASFPTTANTLQMTYGGSTDAFIAKISLAPSPSFALTGFPSSTTAGVAHTFTVTALNANGTVNTGYTGTVLFTSSDPQAALAASYTFTAADQGVHTFTVTLKTAGSQSITATDTVTGNINGSESGIVVQPGAATHLSIGGPSTIRSSSAFSLVVTALDAYGNVATGYVGTIHFTDSASGATLPGNYTFTATDAGVHTFTGVKLRTKGKQTITIVDTLTVSILGTLTITVD
jgi:hypothetical protein